MSSRNNSSVSRLLAVIVVMMLHQPFIRLLISVVGTSHRLKYFAYLLNRIVDYHIEI